MLICRSSGSNLELCTFSSRPSLICPRGDGHLKLAANSDGAAHLDLLCQSPGGSEVVVNVVDLFSRECFSRYLVSVSSNMPTIKDTYELDVAAHTGVILLSFCQVALVLATCNEMS